MAKSKNIESQEIINPLRYLEKVALFSRDLNGFLNCVDYKFNEDNTINWRAMIKPEYLVPNRDKFKGVETKDLDVTTLQDNQLLILLGGLKELAQIRGFNYVRYEVLESRTDYVAVKCTINWIGNYETNFREVEFSSLADAHWDNTHNFAKNFLMAIAENRAFVRAVRNFLKINIVGSDEMGKTIALNPLEESSHTGSHPVSLLEKTMADYGISFDKIKEGAIKKNIEGSDNWNDISDIPPLSIFTIVSGIKNKNKR